MAIVYLAGNKLTGESTDSKPTTVATGSIFVENDTNKTYQFNGSSWDRLDEGVGDSVSESEITGTISDSKLATGISGGKITAGSVTSTQLSSTAVTDSNIGDGTISGAKLTSDSVTATQLSDDSVGAAQIQDDSVGTAQIQDDSVTVEHLAHGTAGKILGFNSSTGAPEEQDASGGGAETHEFTTAQTFTPDTQTGVVRITTDTTDVTSITSYSPSSVQINVDGSSIGAITDTVFTRVVNPSSSLTIQSLNPSDPILNYDSSSASISGGQGLDFKSDGTKAYGINNAWRGIVYEYDLSTAWDLSTLSLTRSYNPPSPNGNGYGMDIRLHPNGTSWYELSRWYNTIHQYNMSTAWNVSTASFGGQGSTTNTNKTASGLFIKDDGINVYVCEYTNGTVQQHSMSTAWDITTLSHDSKSVSVATQESNPQSIYFKSDGTKMYISGGNYKIYRYSLSTAWDVSTASYDSVAYDITTGSNVVNGLYLKPDFSKWYAYAGSTAYQHSIDTTFAGSALVTVG